MDATSSRELLLNPYPNRLGLKPHVQLILETYPASYLQLINLGNHQNAILSPSEPAKASFEYDDL